MRNINCIIILLMFWCGGIIAQTNNKPSELLTKFPFKLFSGGVMVINARFEDKPDTLNFILDTGSGGISLDSTTCAFLHIESRQSDTIITGIGGTRKVHFSFNKTLHLPGLSVSGLNFHVNNYDVLTSVYGEKIDGIIGYSFFSRYIVEIDFDSLLIKVYSPGHHRYSQSGHTLHPHLGKLLIQKARVRDNRRLPFNFIIDTGAGLCLLLSERFAKDSSILDPRRKPITTQAEGMLGRVHMRLTVIKELKLGPYRFHSVPTYLYTDDYNVTSYPRAGGLIGNELLRRFNLVVNYPKSEVHLTPNKFFNESFDYAYTGMGIYFQDGRIMIEDIVKGSPADKAGLMVDDQLIAVDNNITNNIQQYRNLLQRTNERMKLIIRRGDHVYPVILKTANIIGITK